MQKDVAILRQSFSARHCKLSEKEAHKSVLTSDHPTLALVALRKGKTFLGITTGVFSKQHSYAKGDSARRSPANGAGHKQLQGSLEALRRGLQCLSGHGLQREREPAYRASLGRVTGTWLPGLKVQQISMASFSFLWVMKSGRFCPSLANDFPQVM